MFITVFTRARHLSLSWTTWVQSAPSYSFKVQCNIILPSTTRSSMWYLSDFTT
jgi:hypothetical protein